MIYPSLRLATAIFASAVITACADTTAPDPTAPPESSPGPSTLSSEHFGRSGTLHVEKECSQYTGQAGDFCTITSSSLKAIEIGSRVVYQDAASSTGILDTDVRLVPPAPGKSIAFGHCSVDLTNVDGTTGCVWSGGTGKFKRFHARVLLTYVGGATFAWDGTYRFGHRR